MSGCRVVLCRRGVDDSWGGMCGCARGGHVGREGPRRYHVRPGHRISDDTRLIPRDRMELLPGAKIMYQGSLVGGHIQVRNTSHR